MGRRVMLGCKHLFGMELGAVGPCQDDSDDCLRQTVGPSLSWSSFGCPNLFCSPKCGIRLVGSVWIDLTKDPIQKHINNNKRVSGLDPYLWLMTKFDSHHCFELFGLIRTLIVNPSSPIHLWQQNVRTGRIIRTIPLISNKTAHIIQASQSFHFRQATWFSYICF